MRVTYEPSPDFNRRRLAVRGTRGWLRGFWCNRALPYLGMARAELTDFGQRLPTHFEDTRLPSFDDGWLQLEVLLDRMMSESEDLGLTLRLDAARQILREGCRP